MSAPASDRRTPNRAEEGVDAEPASINIVETTFLGPSCVTRMGTIQKIFLVDEELILIKIEKIPGNYYALFKLVFII